MMRRAAVALICVAAVPAVAATTTEPHLRAAANGDISVMLPESILRNDEVKKQLTSGLTTSFVITTTPIRGAARVDVRFDLWDETFAIEVVSAVASSHTFSAPSFDKLVEWWRTTPVRLAHESRSALPASLRIKVDVLPFSATEESRAQKWLSKSLDPSAASSGHARRDNPRSSASEIIDAIIATSIRRRPILSFHWTTPIEAEAPR